MLKKALVCILFLVPFACCAKAPCIVTTVQKCGTHVFSRAISSLTGMKTKKTPNGLLKSRKRRNNFYPSFEDLCTCIEMPSTLVLGHFPYDLVTAAVAEKYKLKILLLVRHPADQAVSFARCAYDPHSYLNIHDHRSLQENISLHITTNQLLYVTKEDCFNPSGTSNIAELFDVYLQWLEKPYVLLVRYEDFIGGQDGSLEQRCAVLAQIAEFLELAVSDEKLLQIAQAIDDSELDSTFRPGQKIGRWKQHFSQENRELMEHVAGGLLERLGYSMQ